LDESSLKKSWLDLYADDKEAGWTTFLDHHNQLIMNVINKLVLDRDEAMDIYTFALDKLKKDDCKKLASFHAKSRNYDFETWIAVVVRNCCYDWFRKEKGRKRLLKVIEDLPELDQWIFRYLYWHRYHYDSAFGLLENKHGFKITFEEMCTRIDQLNETLQRQTKWKLSQDWLAALPPLPLNDADNTTGSRSQDPSPEEELIHSNTSQVIEDILRSLPTQQQLIIQLRFYRNLTLEEIARVLRMKNIWRVHRKLTKGLKLLRKKFQEKGISSSDFDI
jgi:RNA polymerase sigma factor (sigma-70 family)